MILITSSPHCIPCPNDPNYFPSPLYSFFKFIEFQMSPIPLLSMLLLFRIIINFVVFLSCWSYWLKSKNDQVYGVVIILGIGGSTLLVTALTMTADLIADNVVCNWLFVNFQNCQLLLYNCCLLNTKFYMQILSI